ncbi:MAG: TIGR01458 family HAD-type hydrolase, partial [Gammaproteobacteria bacterium]|nr:TIGR01458 family HAD-type hydrolase [Gammaproteobacteria bacterium]
MEAPDSPVTGLLIDLDGVIYQGDAALAGAVDCLAWLEASGMPYLFVTNTTSRPRGAIVDKLAAMGVNTHRDRILTPAVAAVDWLAQQSISSLALFVPEATREEFAGFAIDSDEVGAVVLGDYGEDWDFQTLNRAFRLLMR